MKLTTGLLLSFMTSGVACAVADVKQIDVIKRVCSCMLHHHSSKPSHAKAKIKPAKPLTVAHRAAIGASIDARCACSLHAKHSAKHSHKPSKPKAK